jgi:transcription antitermination factor NusB
VIIENQEIFPLSKEKTIKGFRRLAREKVLQILFAYEVTSSDLDRLFSHIFYRDFNFGDDERSDNPEKLLKPQEVYELEADIPIVWRNADIEFSKELIRLTIQHSNELDVMIEKYADNWEIERISPIDKILTKMAMIELTDFPDIPAKVSINEVLDISKKYSTENSNHFINGLLDAIHTKLIQDGLIKKTGRGLVDH